ncbi:MAG: PQQ-binding-like beta-propeller repeat protein, partial [Abditibacteriales bacterium]|nr:PQQ-binding-like beta-propeller repeat protein [Abditibacteriales bacterium]MDW8368208.1 PQQ-binding-like beta-propeller repeat protein [Abditibacteriales bacterium]
RRDCMRRGLGYALTLALVIITSVAGADWNQWRGPSRDGKVVGFQLPSPLPQQLTRRWKVEVGTGHSSPLVVGSSVFVFARQGDNEVVRCLNLATGKEVWKQSYPAPYEMNPAAQGHGKGPKSTPVYANGLLYTLGISGILSCFDAETGKAIWRHEFSKSFKTTSPLYGAAMSPVVDSGLLIAHVGGHDDGALMAFDARSGTVRWRWAGDGPGYASPIVVNIGGVRQVITQTQKMCVGVEVATGRLLWSLPFTTQYDMNIITPIAVGDVVIFGGYHQPTFAVRVRKSADRWAVEKLWQTSDATFFMSTPVASGNRLYGMSEKRGGQMCSINLITGQVEWTGEARFGENAAVFDAGSVLLVLTTNAHLHVFQKNGAALNEVARYRVADSPTWASPAFAGNRVLVKDATSLTLWEFAR